MRSLLLGAVLGALVALAWTTFSWNVLDWHYAELNAFDNDAAVAAVIVQNTHASGMYSSPSGPADPTGAAELRALENGPLILAAVQRKGFGSFKIAAAIQFTSLLLAAFLLAWMLSQTKVSSYLRRVAFVGAAGLAASIIVDIPYWNWWGFPLPYTLVNLADTTLTWLLAGFVIARFVSPNSHSVSS